MESAAARPLKDSYLRFLDFENFLNRKNDKVHKIDYP